jgi:hypothetical protein
MNTGTTLYCAISSNSKCIRAVLLKEGKIIDRFLTAAQGDDALEDISRFFDVQFIDDDHAPSKIVLIGSTAGTHVTIMHALIEDNPELFQLEFLHSSDIQRILSMEAWTIQEDATFRRMDLAAHLCFLKDNGKPLIPPGRILLEWALDRAKSEYQCLEEKLRDQLLEGLPS